MYGEHSIEVVARKRERLLAIREYGLCIWKSLVKALQHVCPNIKRNIVSALLGR
jgi:hypothetical protein